MSNKFAGLELSFITNFKVLSDIDSGVCAQAELIRSMYFPEKKLDMCKGVELEKKLIDFFANKLFVFLE